MFMTNSYRTLAILAVMLAIAGCNGSESSSTTSSDASTTSPPPQEPVGDASPRVRLTTSKGDILIELNRKAAPITVANFLEYVEKGHYNGTVFHRVIPDFMIQGGGFNAEMQEKPTSAPIRNEADNGLKNTRGTIAMARTRMVHSATSQFFINVVDNAMLDHQSKTPGGYGYCVFGKVIEGMDVVDKIRNVKTGSSGHHQNVPTEPITIEKAQVVEETKAATAP